VDRKGRKRGEKEWGRKEKCGWGGRRGGGKGGVRVREETPYFFNELIKKRSSGSLAHATKGGSTLRSGLKEKKGESVNVD